VFAAARIAELERRVAELEEQMVEVVYAPGMPRACDAGARFATATLARAMDCADGDAPERDTEPLCKRRALCPECGQHVDQSVGV